MIAQLKNLLADFGIFCELITTQDTPNSIIGHFNLFNLQDLSKLKKVCVMLSARFHTSITHTQSDIGDFAIVVVKSQRDFVEWNTAHHNAHVKPYEAVIGQSDSGQFVKIDIRDMVSALCVGASGGGKSNFLHSFINSLCCSTNPQNLGFIMVDCKKSELTRYNDKCGHLMCRVCTSPAETNFRLKQVIELMQNRYSIMQERRINTCPDDFSQIIVIVDELAELMLSTNKKQANITKTMLIRLCQLGRACGIHCLLCTQTPRVSVVDGMIQANTPTKFALKTANVRESVIALGHGGCQNLLGRGDMLFRAPDDTTETRVQVPFISSDTIKKVFADLPDRVWDNSKHKKSKWWQRHKDKQTYCTTNKTALTIQDCIDYDIIDD